MITDSVSRFLGNLTHVDFFKLLRQDGQSVLIGARNVIYNISLHDLTENTQQVCIQSRQVIIKPFAFIRSKERKNKEILYTKSGEKFCLLIKVIGLTGN